MELEQMMFLKTSKELTQIERSDLSIDAKLLANLLGNLCLRVAALQKLQHARCDQVQPEHLPMTNVEDDGAVLVVGRTYFFREPEHRNTPVLRLPT